MLIMVDTRASNLESVLGALKRVGVGVSVTRSVDDIASATAIILPGVGAFAQGMKALHESGLVDVLRHRVMVDKVPILGICLGMQLLAESSEEHGHQVGLGFVKGKVLRLTPSGTEFRVPNIGWCDTAPEKAGVLFPKAGEMRSFYYIHSYYIQCDRAADVAATIDFAGQPVAVAVENENIFGVQFHPEKSQEAGLDLLNGFFKTIAVPAPAR